MCRTLKTRAVTVVSAEEGFEIFLKIYNAHYYPDIDLNLISVGQLTASGCIFSKNKLYIIIYNLAGNKVIHSVYFNNIYVLQNSNIIAATVIKGKTFFN